MNESERVERYIEHLQAERERYAVAYSNAIASAQAILAMLRDGTPLPGEQPVVNQESE